MSLTFVAGVCLFVRLGLEVFSIILPETNGWPRACDGGPSFLWGILGLVIRVTGLCRWRSDVDFSSGSDALSVIRAEKLISKCWRWEFQRNENAEEPLQNKCLAFRFPQK